MKIIKKIKATNELVLLLVTFLISVGALVVFYLNNNQNLSDYDAIARLNIARKVIDSITPGIAQLGGLWLPLPQFLMIPFIWNDFLWHSGFAGAIVSMSSFIIGAIFIYKTAYLITKNKTASFFAWLAFTSNVNILILQTSAMSETFFLFTMIMVLYFLTKWVKQKQIPSLIAAAFFIALMTLTRYEGYVILLFAAICVITCSYFLFRNEKRNDKIEGVFIIFFTLASFGIIIWTFYSLLVFKDPIYWLNLYAGKKDILNDPQAFIDNTIPAAKHTKGLIESWKSYTWASFLMNGILVTILSAAGFIVTIVSFIKSIFSKKINLLLLPFLILSISTYLFLVLGYQKGFIPRIEAPNISISTFFDKNNNYQGGLNIRYGIIFLPFIAIFLGYLASKKLLLTIFVSLIIFLQLITNFYTPLFLMYQLPVKWDYSYYQNKYSYAQWFKKNYDRGLILVSTKEHEPFIFLTGLPYKNFIYEGSRDYWKDSLKNPAKYASWVVFDEELKDDALTKYLKDSKVLLEKFNLVYNDKSLKIYKIKGKPEVNL